MRKDALISINEYISTSEKMLVKFNKGTSQHTLLLNRIHALNVVKAVMNNEINKYPDDEIIRAIAPIQSLTNKCQKAISHQKENTATYQRLKSILDAMEIANDVLAKATDVIIRKNAL